MNKTVQSSQVELDAFVEAYEAALETEGAASFADFLPPREHPEFAATVVELIRIDLEHNWQPTEDSGHGKITEYQGRFPDVLDDPDQLRKVAFEEYRLRRLSGEDVSPEEYRRTFSIPTDGWPELPVGEAATPAPVERIDDSWFRELSKADPGAASRLDSALHALPTAGERFLGFELMAEIGQGAFSRVFLAQQKGLANRHVALKVTAQLTDEPQTLAQLQHTHIVPIYSVHRQGNLLAVCMPFLGSNTLADILKTFRVAHSIPNSGQALLSTLTVTGIGTVGGRAPEGIGQPLPQDSQKTASGMATPDRWEDVSYLNAMVSTIAKVADGLAYAHERGILHRDLKPANILLTDEGQPLLLDFNLSSQRSALGAHTEMIGGTLPYMAPEHLKAVSGSGQIDARSDVYSLGVVMFEMCTGRHPYPIRRGSFEKVTSQMLADRERPAPSARGINRSVTPDVDSIVSRCLALRPRDRYVSARQLQEDLERHIANRPLRYARNRSLKERVCKWSRRHPQIVSASSVTAASVCIVTLMSVLWIFRGRQLEEYRARELANSFQVSLNDARTALNTPWIDQETLDGAVAASEEALSDYHLFSSDGLRDSPSFRHLTPPEQRRLRRNAAEMLYLLAGGKAQQAIRSDGEAHEEHLFNEALRLNERGQELLAGIETPQAFSLQRARFLSAMGRPEVARKPGDPKPEENGGEKDTRLAALEKARQHEYRDAIGLLDEAIRQSPQDYTLWFSLGNCYLGVSEFSLAEGAFTTAVALRPDFTLGYDHRGLARLKAHEYSQARDDFDAVLRRRPDLTAPLVNRALAYQGLGDLEKAIADLTLAIDQGATQTRIYFIRSRLKSRLGDSEGAELDRQRGLQLRPRDELSWIARGVARLTDDPEAALSDFRQALKLNPGSRTALQNVAHVLSERLGQTERAVEVMNQIITIDPKEPAALASRGVLFARLGRLAPALDDAEAALAISNRAETLYQVSGIYAMASLQEAGHAERAIALVSQAFKKKPSLVAIALRDDDLAPLREYSEYRKVVSAALALETIDVADVEPQVTETSGNQQ